MPLKGERPVNRIEIAYDVTDKGCWVCTSHALDNEGYPKARRNGKQERISRIALKERLGRNIMEGWSALHVCNNRQCINPMHLYEGTQSDNMADAADAGTLHKFDPKTKPHKVVYGESHGRSRLTENDVRYIRDHLDETCVELSKKYRVSENCISKARQGRNWKHLK